MANEFARNIRDNSYVLTKALPSAASTTVYSSDIDLGADSYKGENYELEIVVPDMNTTMLPDTRTLTVAVYAGASASPTTEIQRVRVFTGAGGAGSTGATIRTRIPSNCARYMRVGFITGASTGDISSLSATISLRF